LDLSEGRQIRPPDQTLQSPVGVVINQWWGVKPPNPPRQIEHCLKVYTVDDVMAVRCWWTAYHACSCSSRGRDACRGSRELNRQDM